MLLEHELNYNIANFNSVWIILSPSKISLKLQLHKPLNLNCVSTSKIRLCRLKLFRRFHLWWSVRVQVDLQPCQFSSHSINIKSLKDNFITGPRLLKLNSWSTSKIGLCQLKLFRRFHLWCTVRWWIKLQHYQFLTHLINIKSLKLNFKVARHWARYWLSWRYKT